MSNIKFIDQLRLGVLRGRKNAITKVVNEGKRELLKAVDRAAVGCEIDVTHYDDVVRTEVGNIFKSWELQTEMQSRNGREYIRLTVTGA